MYPNIELFKACTSGMERLASDLYQLNFDVHVRENIFKFYTWSITIEYNLTEIYIFLDRPDEDSGSDMRALSSFLPKFIIDTLEDNSEGCYIVRDLYTLYEILQAVQVCTADLVDMYKPKTTLEEAVEQVFLHKKEKTIPNTSSDFDLGSLNSMYGNCLIHIFPIEESDTDCELYLFGSATKCYEELRRHFTEEQVIQFWKRSLTTAAFTLKTTFSEYFRGEREWDGVGDEPYNGDVGIIIEFNVLKADFEHNPFVKPELL